MKKRNKFSSLKWVSGRKEQKEKLWTEICDEGNFLDKEILARAVKFIKIVFLGAGCVLTLSTQWPGG
jgi:hypothetical protein